MQIADGVRLTLTGCGTNAAGPVPTRPAVGVSQVADSEEREEVKTWRTMRC
jgi:hypothetical protein